MTTHAPRVPFAPLDNPRLQHLANAKNRQNGALTQKLTSTSTSTSTLNGKPSIVKKVSSSNKRAFDTCSFDEFDSENVDPSIFDSPTKKNKSAAFEKPFTFTLTSTKSMPPPSAFSSRFSTPVKAGTLTARTPLAARTPMAARTPLTAPAGRSPKKKIAGISKNRRVSAPFSRIDPPFASRSTSTLPFSLDAVLGGTLPAGATIQETMPKNWMFEIYQDTPEEEAANLMEHSTLTLDLSSDDKGGRKDDSDRGKENTPPEGYDAPAAPKTVLMREKADVDEMDDGERSPLSNLETRHFIPEGLDKDSYVVIEEGAEGKEFEKVQVVTTRLGEEKVQVVPTAQSGEEKVQVVPTAQSGEEKVQVLPTAQSGEEKVQVLPTAQSGAEKVQVVPTAQSGEKVSTVTAPIEKGRSEEVVVWENKDDVA